MKQLRILLLLACVAVSSSAYAQSSRSTETKTLRFNSNSAANTFHLFNIQGNIEVTTYNGDEIQVEVSKKFWKKRHSRSNLSYDEIKIVYEQDGNHILGYIDAPGIEVRQRDNDPYRISYNMNDWWDDHRIEFDFDFKIKVPKNVQVDVSTINDGVVYVKGVENGTRARNINGSIELIDVAGFVDVKTVNGDIEVSFVEQPGTACEFKTINGTIEAYFPADFSADITFKSLNGDLYTDFSDTQRLPARVASTSNKRRGSTRYRIDSTAPLRFGNGGPEHAFEVLNGNVYIKQRKS